MVFVHMYLLYIWGENRLSGLMRKQYCSSIWHHTIHAVHLNTKSWLNSTFFAILWVRSTQTSNDNMFKISALVMHANTMHQSEMTWDLEARLITPSQTLYCMDGSQKHCMGVSVHMYVCASACVQVELRKKEQLLERQSEQLSVSQQVIAEQEEELAEVTKELEETERENTRLRQSMEKMMEDTDYNRQYYTKHICLIWCSVNFLFSFFFSSSFSFFCFFYFFFFSLLMLTYSVIEDCAKNSVQWDSLYKYLMGLFHWYFWPPSHAALICVSITSSAAPCSRWTTSRVGLKQARSVCL